MCTAWNETRVKESYQSGQVVDRHACDQESCFTGEPVVRVPPKVAVGGHASIVIVEGLEAVKTANAGTNGLSSQNANGGKDRKTSHYEQVYETECQRQSMYRMPIIECDGCLPIYFMPGYPRLLYTDRCHDTQDLCGPGPLLRYGDIFNISWSCADCLT